MLSVFVLLCSAKPAMSNSNALLGQKSCRYLNQGRTFNDINEGRTLNDVLISEQTKFS